MLANILIAIFQTCLDCSYNPQPSDQRLCEQIAIDKPFQTLQSSNDNVEWQEIHKKGN